MKFKKQIENLLERSKGYDDASKTYFIEARNNKQLKDRYDREVIRLEKLGNEAAETATRYAQAAILLENS